MLVSVNHLLLVSINGDIFKIMNSCRVEQPGAKLVGAHVVVEQEIFTNSIKVSHLSKKDRKPKLGSKASKRTCSPAGA